MRSPPGAVQYFRLEGEGSPQERRKMVFLDPSGNAIEIKSYRDESRLF
jgi:extradiol dioxygenase family protein